MNTMSTFKSHYVTTLVKLMATGFLLGITLVACQQPEEKLKEARNEVANAKQDLKDAKREVRAQWEQSWLKFKQNSGEELADNERRIIELRKEVNNIDARYRAKYNTRIDELEGRINESRDRINNYRDEGDERWESFKTEMRRDMDDLKSSLSSITIRNS